MYAKVHKCNDWYWEAGKVIERVGVVNYNVWLQGQRCGLIRSHVNQLRPRHVAVDRNGNEECLANEALPLSVLLDEFKTDSRATVVEPDVREPQHVQPIEHREQQLPVAGQDRELPSQAVNGSRIPVATTSRGRQNRLPPRFEHYVMP